MTRLLDLLSPLRTGPEIALGVLIWATVVLAALVALLVVVVLVQRGGHVRRERRERRLAAQWTPLLLDVIDGEAPPEAMHAVVTRRDARAFVHTLLAYAFSVRGEAQTRIVEAARPYLRPMARLARRRDPALRLRGIQALGLLGFDAHAATLVAALDDPSDVVAMTAAQMLARGGQADHAAAVVEHLPRFRLWGSTTVASMLALFGSSAGAHLLALFGDATRDVETRVLAGDALRWLNLPETAAVATAVLRGEPDRELRAAALRLLRRLGQSADADTVAPFAHDPDPVLRIHAVSALAALAPPDASVPVLRAAFDDPSHWVALRAARGLGEARRTDVLREIAASDHPRAALARQVLSDDLA